MSVYDLIENQQAGKEGTAVYCVGQQLKDILRAGGAAAEKIVTDDLNSGMTLEKCEKADALARLEEMQKQQKLSASPEIIEFRFYFDEAQQNINHLISIINNAEPETAEKLFNALNALVQLITAAASEV